MTRKNKPPKEKKMTPAQRQAFRETTKDLYKLINTIEPSDQLPLSEGEQTKESNAE